MANDDRQQDGLFSSSPVGEAPTADLFAGSTSQSNGVAQGVSESDEFSDALRDRDQQPVTRVELFEWMDSIVYSVAVVVLLLSFAFRMIGVVGSSMYSTLHNGDRVMLVLGQKPRAGDVVVLTKLNDPLIKRVVATGGQTVDIDFANGEVFVDGVLLDEPYINEPTHRREDVAFPITVPAGHVFVMGDNRNHSSDSRTSQVGFIDERHVIGRVAFRVLPIGRAGKLPW